MRKETLAAINFYRFSVQPQLNLGKTGQIAHARHHLVAFRKKLSSRVTLLRRLVGSGWSAGVKTLSTAALSLFYSATECCAPVLCCNVCTFLKKNVLNNALCVIPDYLRPTPTNHQFILSAIQPTELRLLGAIHPLVYRESLDPDGMLQGILTGSSDALEERLRSRRPFVPAAQILSNNLSD